MKDIIANNNITVVVGMGQTGLSVAKYLQQCNRRFMVVDTRDTPPLTGVFKQTFPELVYETGELNPKTLCAASAIILSPGVSKAEPAIQQALNDGIPVLGDIELFIDAAKAPIVAITGTNGKSTVTTLVGEMAKQAGKQVAVGGNLGIPALELLSDNTELYILELSSYQLETTRQLNAEVACILNISADHLDRYDSMAAYVAAKQRIYFGAKNIVINREDVLTAPPISQACIVHSFGCSVPDRNGFGISQNDDGEVFITYEFSPVMPVKAVKMQGKHNLSNALAALATGKAAGVPLEPMLDVLRHFSGLEHRCQWVAEKNNVDFFNDSKGTNVGATLAALEGLDRLPHKLILIAGGDGKGADFTPLKSALNTYVRAVVLIGQDAGKIADITPSSVTVKQACNLPEAVQEAFHLAQAGDAVLLSPACASLDMFQNYQERGHLFVKAVLELL